MQAFASARRQVPNVRGNPKLPTSDQLRLFGAAGILIRTFTERGVPCANFGSLC